eukprot:tig00021680_g23023.t1
MAAQFASVFVSDNNDFEGIDVGVEEYETELTDCCTSPKTASLACLCPCYVIGKLERDLAPRGEVLCCSVCFACVCLPCCYGASVRRKFRHTFSIKGDIVNDCLAYSFCLPLAAAQDVIEFDRRMRNTMRAPPGRLIVNPGGGSGSGLTRRDS